MRRRQAGQQREGGNETAKRRQSETGRLGENDGRMVDKGMKVQIGKEQGGRNKEGGEKGGKQGGREASRGLRVTYSYSSVTKQLLWYYILLHPSLL